jgi:hypothetical protein
VNFLPALPVDGLGTLQGFGGIDSHDFLFIRHHKSYAKTIGAE